MLSRDPLLSTLLWGLLLAALSLEACQRERPEGVEASLPASAKVPPSSAPAPSSPDERPTSTPHRQDRLTLLAGGDISFGRMVGQILLKEPERDFFSTLDPWLRSSDVRFANLESQLSDQHGETQSPTERLVFTGPPSGASALSRSGFDIVSTANNHAWDYGKKAFFETMENLERAGVLYAGTRREKGSMYGPTILERAGFRLAFFAVTDVWNQGPLSKHEAADYVARVNPALFAAVRSLKESGRVDVIAVSYHGGTEYENEPLTRTKESLRMALDAGADVVFGHHPHVVQGIEFYGEKPIFYSLGNLLMRMHRDYSWTEFGYMAKLVVERKAAPFVFVCPFRMFGITPLPLASDPHREAYERRFYDHLRSISRGLGGGLAIGSPESDGCAPIRPSLGSR